MSRGEEDSVGVGGGDSDATHALLLKMTQGARSFTRPRVACTYKHTFRRPRLHHTSVMYVPPPPLSGGGGGRQVLHRVTQSTQTQVRVVSRFHLEALTGFFVCVLWLARPRQVKGCCCCCVHIKISVILPFWCHFFFFFFFFFFSWPPTIFKVDAFVTSTNIKRAICLVPTIFFCLLGPAVVRPFFVFCLFIFLKEKKIVEGKTREKGPWGRIAQRRWLSNRQKNIRTD